MAKHLIRFPLRSTGSFFLEGEIDYEKMDDIIRSKVESGKFLISCQYPIVSERSIVAVCEDCGAELIGDEEHEIGLCLECQDKDANRQMEEAKHPDNKGA